MRSVVPDQGYG